MDSRVTQAYKLAKEGEKTKAQKLLVSVIKDNDRNEDAWYLLGFLVESEPKKIRCFQKVIEINPDNEKALKALSRLKKTDMPKIESTTASSLSVNIHKGSNIFETPAQVDLPRNPPEVIAPLTDQQLVEQYISMMSAQGWTVVSLTSNSVQLIDKIN
ncbi:MAG: hypothetical protein H6657_23395 [Ardenticatenaceae bacterium]|nr:hypothetical protein [Ardenticatenaceae bacterium]